MVVAGRIKRQNYKLNSILQDTFSKFRANFHQRLVSKESLVTSDFTYLTLLLGPLQYPLLYGAFNNESVHRHLSRLTQAMCTVHGLQWPTQRRVSRIRTTVHHVDVTCYCHVCLFVYFIIIIIILRQSWITSAHVSDVRQSGIPNSVASKLSFESVLKLFLQPGTKVLQLDQIFCLKQQQQQQQQTTSTL